MTSSARLYFVVTCVSLSFLFFPGCSGSGPGKGTVSGKVTVDGQPLADGTINFFPTDGTTPTSGGKIVNGEYSVEVYTGNQKVVISAQKVTGTRPAYQGDPNSPKINITKEILPPTVSDQAQSTITLDVKRGANKQDHTLTSVP